MTERTMERAYRLADSHNHGWLVGNDGTYSGYDPSAVHSAARLAPRSREEIEREFGPVRPVLPMLDSDAAELREALRAAGRKAIGSVASALELVHFEARERFGPWDRDANATAAYADRTLTAGRPGSWEAAALLQLVHFGAELNLYRASGGGDVRAMRQAEPHPKRVDVGARDRIAEVLRRWTNSPGRYTEVAENLVEVVSFFGDDEYGREGWKHLADQWLQPGGLAREAFELCHGLLYARSAFRVDLP